MISIAPMGVFSIAYTKTSKCFSLVYEVALLFQVNVIGLEFGIKTIRYYQISFRCKLNAFVKATS